MSRLVIVLGMHRSGTSVIVRSLQCLGVVLGPRAMWNGSDNPSGFFENQDILAIDERVLGIVGRDWDDPTPIHALSSRVLIDPVLARLAHVGEQILQAELGRHEVFAIKEPRLCRLLPFWRPILNRIGCSVSVVHAIRHPMAVAMSLHKRNQIPILNGLKLWLEYTKRANLDVDQTWPSVTVSYDNMMDNPIHELVRIRQEAKIPGRPNSAEIANFRLDYLDEMLRHETSNGTPLPPDVAEEWEVAMKKAST